MTYPTRPSVDPNTLRSRLRPMLGRDPQESGRAASTLELLFDLTFVVAIATSASQLAHALALGHVSAGVGAFLFSSFGITWAWINYTWFASAFDTDDWLYRILTLLQMVGVVVFTLGIPDLFHAVDTGHFNHTMMVTGYVIMRIAMLAQWARAYRSCTASRPAIRFYMGTLALAQVLWVASIWLKDSHLPLPVAFAVVTLFALLELAGPVLAERSTGTPWHAHHVVERHGLLTIITIGEVVTGTVLTLQEIKDAAGRDIDWTSAILVAVSGVALAFGLWWVYFMTPFATVLHGHRTRVFGFAYSHYLIWPAVAAIGSGLHVMALSFEEAKPGSHGIDHLVAAYSLAVPVGVFMVGLFLTRYLTMKFWTHLYTGILAGALMILTVAVYLAAHHAPLALVLGIVTLVPWLVVAVFESSLGARHEAESLGRQAEPDGSSVALR